MTISATRERELVVLQILESDIRKIRSLYRVKKIGVFGSHVRGEEKPDSDVDVIVEFMPGRSTYKNFINLAEHLEKVLNRKVDLITTKGLDPLIREQVEEEVIWSEA